MIGVAGGVKREEIATVLGEDAMAGVTGGVRSDRLWTVVVAGWLLVVEMVETVDTGQ